MAAAELIKRFACRAAAGFVFYTALLYLFMLLCALMGVPAWLPMPAVVGASMFSSLLLAAILTFMEWLSGEEEARS